MPKLPLLHAHGVGGVQPVYVARVCSGSGRRQRRTLEALQQRGGDRARVAADALIDGWHEGAEQRERLLLLPGAE